VTSLIRREGSDLLLRLRVQPRASKDELLVDGERLRLRITAPPVDGAANNHLIRFLAKTFGVSNSRVEIVRGLSGREKTVRIIEPTVIPPVLIAIDTEDESLKPLKK
jgi:uncharacterized protein (TIGR00251 family)